MAKNAALPADLEGLALPKHIAIIMDGNGRWAQKRGLPRSLGHRQGVEALESIVETCSNIGIEVLTVYAFSTENWKRSVDEVSLLMNLLVEFAHKKLDKMHKKGLCINILGDVDGLPENARNAMLAVHEKTKNNTGMIFNIAINYGGRQEIVRAVKSIAKQAVDGQIDIASIDENMVEKNLYTCGLPDVDLLIRTSGELRISNYLLWQLAYSEFFYTNVLWPDFGPDELYEALLAYAKRDRRFGGIKK